jgi:flagellar hook-associated protein 2
LATTTINNLKNWVNALGDNLSASIVPTSGSNYALKIQGTQPGSDNSIAYSHTSSGVAVNGLGSPVVAPTVVAAQNASFTLDGVAYTRNSNTITDALSGVTINLIKASTVHQSISVDKGDDQAPQMMQGLVNAFNDLVTTAKKLSSKASSSSGATTNGSLANSPSALNFLNQIKSMLNGDIHYTLAGNAGTISMGELGFEMQYDGTAKFNATTFKEVENASAILASGIKVGYQTYVVRDPVTGLEISKNTTDITLNSYLTSLLKVTTSTTSAGTQTLAGAFDQMIKNEQSNIDSMSKKERALQLQLAQKERSYISQYSALNELLFKLSNTSNSLTNALSGLTNGQNNN